MSEIKLTKNELRSQQVRLSQLEKYLPTLQLKKALLQSEVNEVRGEIVRLENAFQEARLTVSQSSALFSIPLGIDLRGAGKIQKIDKKYENIAGVDIPIFEDVFFEPFEYPLFTTPPWLDAAVHLLRQLAIARALVLVS